MVDSLYLQKKHITMKQLLLIFAIICTQNITAQKFNGTYIWKSAETENEKIVSEIKILNDSTFVKYNYTGNIDIKTDYKTWKYKTIDGTIIKDGKFYMFWEYENGKAISFNLVKIKPKAIWF